MFFASTLSSWENISVDSRMRLKTFLFADPRSRFSQKLMQLVCLRKPAEVAQLLSSDDRLFRRFFRDDTTTNRAKAWFAHFNFPGPFEKGALALERYAMTHRDQVWNRLVWLYSTAPSPVVIAHQKIRFLELDVVRTVQMLVDEEPSFWSSEFFRESLLNGDFLALDYAFFAEELCRRLDSPQVRLLAESCLRNEPFRELCNRVLLELDDKSMLHWLYKLVPLNEAPSMEQLFVTQPKWSDLEELMLFSALLTQSKAVTKLLAEEPPETQATLQSLIIASIPTTEQGRQAVEAAQLEIEREALDDGAVAYAKAAILVSFIMRVTLLTFYADRSSLQSIFKQEVRTRSWNVSYRFILFILSKSRNSLQRLYLSNHCHVKYQNEIRRARREHETKKMNPSLLAGASQARH